METIETLGTVLTGKHERDAIHMAVMPVIVGYKHARPGDEVGLVYGTSNTVKARDSIYGLKTIGILDPFLFIRDREHAFHLEGKTVWCFLHPGSITGLKHVWTHPEIDAVQAPTSDAERWLREFADRWNFDYDQMIAEATAPATQAFDHFITAQGIDLHDRSELGPDHDVFWANLERMTGKRYDRNHRELFGWSCSC